jgi:hypothetical protein
MEFVTNKVNFYYDPRRQGYDPSIWKTTSGTPVVSGNNLVFNTAAAIGKADISRGEITFALIVPTAPTAGDDRYWGLGHTANFSSLAVFKILDDGFFAYVYDNAGNYKSERIDWDVAWNAAEVDYKIKYAPDGFHFYVDGVEKSFINRVFTTGTGATLQSAADTVTDAAHGLVDGQMVVLSNIATTTGIDDKTNYFVVNKTTNTFQLALSEGGAVVDLGTGNGTCDYQVYPNVDLPKFPFSLAVNNTDGDDLEIVYVGVADADLYGSGMTVSVSSASDMVNEPYDYISDTWDGVDTEVFVYKAGGALGTTVATLTLLYTDATRAQLVSVTKT